MIERPATWSEVSSGTTLLSPTDAPLLIIRTKVDGRGRTWYLAADHQRREFRIAPKPSEAPVIILECTPEEAEWAAIRGIGAQRVIEFEREARMPERAKRWIVPPFPAKGRGALERARDHVDWYHGAYSGPADASGGFKTLKQIMAAHLEMHDAHFMDMPHTHEEG